MNILRKISKFFRTKLGRWALVLASIILLFLFLRSCKKIDELHQTTYHIARRVNWSPIQLSGKEANVRAFIDEILTNIAEDEELSINVATFQSDDLFAKLDSHEFDAILVTLSMDPFLKTRYAVSDSIFIAGPVLVVPKESSVTSLEELKGRPIGVSKESTMVFRLASQHPDLQLVTYDTAVGALNQLEAGAVVGVIMEAQLAYTYTEVLYSGRLKVATPQLVDLGIRLVARKNAQGEHFIEHFNKGLERLRKEGEYDLLLERWGLVSPK